MCRKQLSMASMPRWASATTLHEYAFVVETIAARLKAHSKLSFDAVSQLSAEFWHRFDGEHKKIQVYDGVHETLQDCAALLLT